MSAAPACPRCRVALRPAEVDGVALDLCPDCEGVLVAQRRVVPLLDRLARALAAHVALDGPIEPWPDPGGGGPCPTCGGAMEPFGYMGTRLVTVDRCRACEALWVDPGELGVMARLHARTNLRREARAASTASLERELDQLVRATLRGRLAQKLVL